MRRRLTTVTALTLVTLVGSVSAETDPTEIIFSDFVAHRVLMFLTVRPTQRTSVNLFVDHEPQRHKIEDDDSTTTLFSLDIAYTF